MGYKSLQNNMDNYCKIIISTDTCDMNDDHFWIKKKKKKKKEIIDYANIARAEMFFSNRIGQEIQKNTKQRRNP